MLRWPKWTREPEVKLNFWHPCKVTVFSFIVFFSKFHILQTLKISQIFDENFAISKNRYKSHEKNPQATSIPATSVMARHMPSMYKKLRILASCMEICKWLHTRYPAELLLKLNSWTWLRGSLIFGSCFPWQPSLYSNWALEKKVTSKFFLNYKTLVFWLYSWFITCDCIYQTQPHYALTGENKFLSFAGYSP